MTMLTEEDVKAYYRAKNEYKSKSNVIFKRLSEVLEIYGKFFGLELDYWYFSDASESEVGTFSYYGDTIDDLVIRWKGKLPRLTEAKHKLYNKYKNEAHYPDLFNTDEGIMTRLEAELQELVSKKEDERQKREERKARKEKTKQAALSKLTPEEVKALGLKKK